MPIHPLLPKRPRKHTWNRRRPLTAAPPAPIPPVLVESVYQSGAGSFLFYWSFDEPFEQRRPGGGDWTVADFVNLTVSSQSPSGLDEIIGVDRLIGLIYDNLQDPDEATLWELTGPVPKLVFPDGRPLPPQDGTILH